MTHLKRVTHKGKKQNKTKKNPECETQEKIVISNKEREIEKNVERYMRTVTFRKKNSCI